MMQCRIDNIKLILDTLRSGDLNKSLEYFQSANVFQDIADIRYKEKLDKTDIEYLDLFLRMCNIFYNQTDLDPQPVEDGVYDLLLELYKQYNPTGFQVGSEIINFDTMNKQIETTIDKINPLRFYTDDDIEKYNNNLFNDDLYKEAKTSLRDFYINPIKNIGIIDKRKHNTPHEHPELVGTLDKCKFVLCKDAEEYGVLNDSNVKVLERDFFAYHIKKGILDPNRVFSMVLELKYDGVSVEADCSNIVESARSRGDTGVGAASDITPILYGYPFNNATELISDRIGVKFEAIMTHQNLHKFNIAKNYSYKNCRSAIVGLFGGGDAGEFRDYITLVPLALDRTDIPDIEWNRELEIEFLNKYYATKGIPLKYAIIQGNYKQCLYQIDAFRKEAEVARDNLNFMYDGIVVSYLDEDLRQALGRENFINKYSMAVKFNPLVRQTMFRGYTYTVGQDGSITPMIHYNQVEFFGTIHNKSTGSSYKRFKDLALRPGDILEVKYMNDVMPYVTKADCYQNFMNKNPEVKFISECPSCGSKLIQSDSGKTMLCPNVNCDAKIMARTVNMLQKLNLKDFSDASILVLGVYSLSDIMNVTKEHAINALGSANGIKFIERVNELKTKDLYDYEIIGALGFTNIGKKKWQLIFNKYTLDEVYNLYIYNQLEVLSNINGIGKAIADTIRDEFEFFSNDIMIIRSMPNVHQSKGKSTQPSIRCTGFRNPELMEQLRKLGYDADDNGSVTKTTDILLVPFKGFTSSKIKKAGPNTKVLTVDELRDLINFES